MWYILTVIQYAGSPRRSKQTGKPYWCNVMFTRISIDNVHATYKLLSSKKNVLHYYYFRKICLKNSGAPYQRDLLFVLLTG